MGKQKTVFVWILLVLLGIVFVFELFSFVGSLAGLIWVDPGQVLASLDFVSVALILAALAVQGIYFVKLYNVRPDVFLWTHIAFGVSIGTLVINFILLVMLVGVWALLASPLMLFGVVLEACAWVGITMHLKRAEREKLMEFS